MTTNRYVARRMEITILILSTVIVVNLKKENNTQLTSDGESGQKRQVNIIQTNYEVKSVFDDQLRSEIRIW